MDCSSLRLGVVAVFWPQRRVVVWEVFVVDLFFWVPETKWVCLKFFFCIL